MELLPKEIIFGILRYLPYADLLSVSEVSRKFLIISKQILLENDWDDVDKIWNGTCKNPIDLIQTLKHPRFRKIKKLKIIDSNRTEEFEEMETEDGDTYFTLKSLNIAQIPFQKDYILELLKTLVEIDLVDLEFDKIDLSGVNPKIISRVVNKAEKVSLSETTIMDDEQIEQILMDLPSGKLKKLTAYEFPLKEIVDTDVLSKAINSLESCECYKVDISKEALSAIYHQMSLQTNLKKFKFESHFDDEEDEYGSWEISGPVLGKALNKLESIYIGFSNSNLGPDNVLEFFRQMSRETNLKTVNVGFNDPLTLAHIPAKILSRGVNKLSSFTALENPFTPIQLKTILDDMARKNSKIKKLYLDLNNPEDLPFLSLATLRSVIPRINTRCQLIFALLRRVFKIYDGFLRNLQQKFRYQQKMKTHKLLLKLRRRLGRTSFTFYLGQECGLKKLHKYVMKEVKKAVRLSISLPKADNQRLPKKQKVKV